MVNKRQLAKKAIMATPIGAKIKLLKILLIGLVISFFMIPVFLLVIFAPSDDNEGENGEVVCKGGNVNDEGLAVFEKNAKGGALEGKTKDLVKIAKKHDIPPNLFLAIVAHESLWGRGVNATKQKNPFSLMGSGTIYDNTFPTLDKGLEAGAKNLQDLYISEGLDTPKKIGPKYAPTVGATNDDTGSNNHWIPNVERIMKEIGSSSEATCESSTKGKKMKFNGKLPKWSNDNPGKGNLYTAGQCTWYAYGIRQKMGKSISTYWHDAHKWNERAEAEGYKVDKKPEPGALFIAEQGAGGHAQSTGHVAVVIGVSDGGKKFRVSEMNWEGEYRVSERDLTMTDGYSFIHDKE
ncbi:CHAP domain-containing protein [Mammaliicoccus sciuri]|uniref:CHAP domain-containing protein n=1 Tax=Mammaliicoccus sciuri TaxID=1296 RepID=UPI0021D2982C|nr:CHAP domain-containing protein [Mammaliicoccus sciuri]UXV29656.1 CHAP domain-containing protein [Mammaliicoccus sciuri]